MYLEPTGVVPLLSLVTRLTFAAMFEGATRGLERYVRTELSASA